MSYFSHIRGEHMTELLLLILCDIVDVLAKQWSFVISSTWTLRAYLLMTLHDVRLQPYYTSVKELLLLTIYTPGLLSSCSRVILSMARLRRLHVSLPAVERDPSLYSRLSRITPPPPPARFITFYIIISQSGFDRLLSHLTNFVIM